MGLGFGLGLGLGLGFGSKSEYLADLERMFCAAPTITASMRGVVPSAAMRGVTCAQRRKVLSSQPRERGVSGKVSGGVSRGDLRGRRGGRDRRGYSY